MGSHLAGLEVPLLHVRHCGCQGVDRGHSCGRHPPAAGSRRLQLSPEAAYRGFRFPGNLHQTPPNLSQLLAPRARKVQRVSSFQRGPARTCRTNCLQRLMASGCTLRPLSAILTEGQCFVRSLTFFGEMAAVVASISIAPLATSCIEKGNVIPIIVAIIISEVFVI